MVIQVYPKGKCNGIFCLGELDFKNKQELCSNPKLYLDFQYCFKRLKKATIIILFRSLLKRSFLVSIPKILQSTPNGHF